MPRLHQQLSYFPKWKINTPSFVYAFVKTCTFWMGAGVVAIGISGVIAWQSWYFENAMADEILSREGFVFNPPEPQLGANNYNGFKEGEKHDQFEFTGWGCFDNFFPGVEVKQGLIVEGVKKSDSIAAPSKDSQNMHIPMGCALMEYSQKSPSDPGDFLFKAEVSIKSGDYGWVIWAGAGGGTEGSTKFQKVKNSVGKETASTVQYRVLFLEQNVHKTWEIKDGVGWYDGGVDSADLNTGDFKANFKLFISPPEEDPWRTISESKKTYEKYFGMWYYDSENRGEEVLEGVKLSLNKDRCHEDNCELLGRSKWQKWDETGKSYGFEKSTFYYDKDRGWIIFKDDQSLTYDATNTLKDWYDPFKDKKGHWINMENFCKDEFKKRNLNQVRKQILRDFCYVRKDINNSIQR